MSEDKYQTWLENLNTLADDPDFRLVSEEKLCELTGIFQQQQAIIAGLVEVLKELSGCYIYDEGSLFDVRTRSGHVYTEYKGAKQALKDTQALAKQHDERVRREGAEAIHKLIVKEYHAAKSSGLNSSDAFDCAIEQAFQPQGGETDDGDDPDNKGVFTFDRKRKIFAESLDIEWDKPQRSEG